MFYDPRLGKAITLTGQYIIMKVGSHCDKRFNEFFKTDNLIYTFYSDTDSCYLNMKPVVDKYWKDQPDLKIVDALDKLMETKLRPFINEATDEIARVQNHFDKTIHFKREAISSSGFWCVDATTVIKTEDGSVNIADLFESCDGSSDVKNVDFVKCLTTNINSGDIEVKSITKVMRKKYTGDMYTIETPTGEKMRVTADHQVMVLRETKRVWIKAKHLKETDILITLNR